MHEASSVVEQRVGSYGTIQFRIGLTSQTIASQDLDRAVQCVSAHLAPQLEAQGAHLEGILPKTEGTTDYVFAMHDSVAGHQLTIDGTLLLDFALIRYLAYGTLSACVDEIIPHIAQHFDDPDGAIAREQMETQMHKPEFQLLCLMHGQTPTEGIKEQVDYCESMMNIADSIVPPTPPAGLSELVARARTPRPGVVVLDLSPKSTAEEKIGMYM